MTVEGGVSVAADGGGMITDLVDSHAHLDLCGDAEAAAHEATAAGVARILAAGIDIESSRLAIGYAGRFPHVLACAGLHPNETAAAGDEEFAELESLARQPGCAAVGETGLDYYRERSPRDIQESAFIRHIELARAARLPLVVHTREAAADTLRILKQNAQDVTVVLHCFSLSGKVAECARRGYLMSLAGNVTFKNAADLREAARLIPPELLLTETDSPFLTPVPHRGKPNRPANVAHVTTQLASARGASPQELAGLVLANFDRTFRDKTSA